MYISITKEKNKVIDFVNSDLNGVLGPYVHILHISLMLTA